MSTPRSRAIATTLHIRKVTSSGEQCPVHITPADEDLVHNRIEHYGALGAIFDQGINSLLQDASILTQLHNCTSAAQLRRQYTDALSVSMQQALLDNPSVHSELMQSQNSRVAINPNVWRHVEHSIDAGAQTAINTIEAAYELLSHLFGSGVAQHPSNYVIIDKMAKLNIDHMTLYRDVYLESVQNQLIAQGHFISPGQGGVKWAQGFPGNALIPVALSKPKRIISRDDLSLAQECMPLKDIPTTFSDTIGCPITFNQSSIKSLWQLYLECITSLEHLPAPHTLRNELALRALDGLNHPDDTAE